MARINMKQMAADVAMAVPGADSIAHVQKTLKAFMVRLVLFTEEEIMALVKKYRKAK